MQSILIIVLTCNFYPDGVSETLNYFNFVALNTTLQQLPEAREHTREENYGEQKTEESLIKLGSVMTSAVPQWRLVEITSGA